MFQHGANPIKAQERAQMQRAAQVGGKTAGLLAHEIDQRRGDAGG